MHTVSFNRIDKTILWFMVVIGLMSLPMLALAGGGGGGGGGSAPQGPGVSINGSLAGTATNGAVSGISTQNGSISGTFQGISVGFNSVSGQWEGSTFHGGEGGGGGGQTGPTCSGCTYVPPPQPPATPQDPTGLTHYCSADGSSVTLRWNAVTVSALPMTKHNLFSLRDLRSLLMTHSAHAAGGDGGYDSGVKPPNDGAYQPNTSYGDATVRYPVMVSQNGAYDNPVFSSEVTGTSVTVGVVPGNEYSWRVRACSRGVCGNWQNSSFRCAPPPSVDLNADPTTVRYNSPSKLTWTSIYTAPVCQAQFGWSGNRPNQNTSGEGTGNLTAATNYRLICPAQYDFPPAIDDVTVNVTSCVAGAKVSASKNLVRKGEAVTLTYNTGAANPAQCVLKAGSVTLVDNLADNGDRSASCSDGSAGTDRTYTYEANGEVDITWECEGQLIDTLRIKVLPEFQET